MKKSFFGLLTLVAVFSQTVIAQNFEGYIKYSFTIDLGEANNAKMAEMNEKMNSPEMKAQMQVMKDKMNDPEFKKMVEGNPQLKAQMDAMMAASSSANKDNLLPKEAIVSFKNGNSLFSMIGGAAALTGDVLYLKDKDQSYQLHRDRKTYRVLPKGEQKKSTATVTKTTETKIVLGHTCTKYIVKDGERSMNVWATTELKNLTDQMKKMSLGKEHSLYMDQIEGIPLKIESTSKEIHFTMQVVEIKEQQQNIADFSIPTGYKEEFQKTPTK
ncbi:MAG: hypothetical protein JWO58_2548 [Chitinophagaceae bacterium]|nr:hypothetical protein [Chitinophagaceae bacterium]